MNGGFCPYFGNCGGCSCQHTPYQEQVAEKSRLLVTLMEAALQAANAAVVPPLETIPSPSPIEYRNRVELHRLPGNPPARRIKKLNLPQAAAVQASALRAAALRAGFMAKKSGTVVPVADCPIAVPEIRAALQQGILTPPPDKDRWTVYGKDGRLLTEGGKSRGKISLLDKTLTVDAGVFFQSNAVLLEKLIADIVGLAREAGGGLCWDLYSGAGTFAVFLRDCFSQLHLMEANKTALALARQNLGAGCTAGFFPLNDTAWAREMGKRSRLEQPAFVCADPPREGLSPELRRFLIRARPRTLAYVSCNPRALQRDTQELVSGGLTLSKLRLYDFYPHTPHIESLAVFLGR
jgi:23S rRNA (uracil1939-C5)-methyltransferase